MATYIATTTQGDKEIAITELVQGAYKFHMQIYIANIIYNALWKYKDLKISHP